MNNTKVRMEGLDFVRHKTFWPVLAGVWQEFVRGVKHHDSMQNDKCGSNQEELLEQ